MKWTLLAASAVITADIVGATPTVNFHDAAGVTGPVIFDSVGAFAIPAPGSDGAGRNIGRAFPWWACGVCGVGVTNQLPGGA